MDTFCTLTRTESSTNFCIVSFRPRVVGFILRSSFVRHSFVVRSSFVCRSLFVCSFVRLFVCLFVRSFVRLLVRSLPCGVSVASWFVGVHRPPAVCRVSRAAWKNDVVAVCVSERYLTAKYNRTTNSQLTWLVCWIRVSLDLQQGLRRGRRRTSNPMLGHA